MRFGVSFPLLPDHAPEEFYKVDKVEKRKVKFKLSMNKDTVGLIRRLAGMLPKEIFTDPHVFPLSPDVAVRVADMVENPQCYLKWNKGDYVCVPEGDALRLYRCGRLVAEGDSFDIFKIVLEVFPEALACVVALHRMGIYKFPKVLGGFAERLKTYRAFRTLSRGLDRCSKVDELDFVDQDHTANKFYIDMDMWGNYNHTTVYHFGAGTNVSSSQRSLWMYERVVLVDPRLVAGVDSLKCTWQEVLDGIPADADIVSDVAFGDKFGMLDDGFQELLDVLYPLCENRLVVSKLSLNCDYKNYRGFIVSKPRPHNAEVVVWLCPDGDALAPLIYELIDKADEANEQRNRRMLAHSFPDVVKPTFNSSSFLAMLARMRCKRLPKAGPPRPRRVNRTQLLYEAIAGEDLFKRRSAWVKALSCFDVPPGPFVVLPNHFYLYPGTLTNFDPGIGDVNFSLRSVIETARYQRFKVYFDIVWKIKN